MTEPVRAELWETPGGAWHGRLDTDPPTELSAQSRRACLDRLAAAAADGTILVIEERPQLVGVAEAAAILGWDRRRVITYVDRGRFPEPIARLAGGRVWRRSDVEGYAAGWRLRRAARGG
ncbi:MAG: helix-turn-helix domain-containing protein [Actinobacteria bacterium]|nr:helix-turn-helix domain-containing protein [Actinomycetota bacterium]